jgi:hypothetical protein
MANEIQLTIGLRVANGSFLDVWNPPPQQITQTDPGSVGGTFTVNTTPTTISLTGLTTFGLMRITNLDPTHYVVFGADSNGTLAALGKLKPTESFLLRLAPGITLKAQADTGPCKVDVRVFED